MAKQLSESIEYVGPVTVPEPGEPAAAAVVEAAIQLLADRTRWLFVESVGSRLAQSEVFDTGESVNPMFMIVDGPEDDPDIEAVIIGGADGDIISTQDGETWTARTNDGAFAGQFFCGVWVPSLTLYVIAGSSGEIQTSPDGITWTARTADASYAGTFLGADVTAAGTIVLVGTDGEIQTSTNGTAWTRRTNPLSTGDLWAGIVWDGSRLMVGGFVDSDPTTPAVATSADGISWVSATAWTPADPTPLAGMEITYGNGVHVISGAGAVHVSDDIGVTWDAIPLTSRYGNATYVYALTYANGVFAAYTIDPVADIVEIFFSPDAREWVGTGTIADAATYQPWGSVYALGRWMSATNGGHVIRSAKGARV